MFLFLLIWLFILNVHTIYSFIYLELWRSAVYFVCWLSSMMTIFLLCFVGSDWAPASSGCSAVGLGEDMSLEKKFTCASVSYSRGMIYKYHFDVTVSTWGFPDTGSIVLNAKSTRGTGIALHTHSGDLFPFWSLADTAELPCPCWEFSFTEGEALQGFWLYVEESVQTFCLCRTKASTPNLT